MSIVSEKYLHDPVPKNVTKFPIHQTYLTSDSEKNSNGGYKFKCPEVWSSARSGKKSIAIRSIEWQQKQFVLDFSLVVHKTSDADDHQYDQTLNCNMIIGIQMKTQDILINVYNQLSKQISASTFNLLVDYNYNKIAFEAKTATNLANTYTIKLVKNDIEKDSHSVVIFNSFDNVFNQPYTDNDNNFYETIILNNVWDRNILNFHASFIPFDNYQYLGILGDKWDKPIIYQDPNSSPLFNIWTTTDMKNVFPILHEEFIFRFTFYISADSKYK